MMYYMGKHRLSALLGSGPKYTVVMLQHQAHKGLDKVQCGGAGSKGCSKAACRSCHVRLHV